VLRCLIALMDISAVRADPLVHASAAVVGAFLEKLCEFCEALFMYMLHLCDQIEGGCSLMESFLCGGIAERLINVLILFSFIVFCRAQKTGETDLLIHGVASVDMDRLP